MCVPTSKFSGAEGAKLHNLHHDFTESHWEFTSSDIFCRLHLHARKFREILEGFDAWSVEKSTVPPAAALTNGNMKLFLVKCWETGSKPNVQQGRKWLNHALTKNGQPPLNKWNRQHYHETLDMLKGLSKEVEWREHVPKSTAAFDLIAT